MAEHGTMAEPHAHAHYHDAHDKTQRAAVDPVGMKLDPDESSTTRGFSLRPF